MNTLWTPWRIEHVLGKAEKKSYCIFEPPGDAPHSKAALLLYRDELAVILLNRFPYANGHILLAPKRHVSCITELTPEENAHIMHLTQKTLEILKNQLQPDGFNIGCNLGKIAGAGIADHLHYHIVPRWDGDHNFISVIGELRTIPEHFEATFDKLLPDFQKITLQK
ncbi:MAG: HIT family hydrolase [Desulfobacterales bacterium]|nr:MAG: HIT family hydrolase [Desulfobacterales bacterium]